MDSPQKNKPSDSKKQHHDKKSDPVSSEIEKLMNEIEMRNEALKKIFNYFERKDKIDDKDS
jgi:hypothetical protein